MKHLTQIFQPIIVSYKSHITKRFMHSVEVNIRIYKLEKVNIRQYLNLVPYDHQSGVLTILPIIMNGHLTLTTLWADSADDKLMIIFLFFKKTGYDISCKLSPVETICIKCQNLFSKKNKKNISMSSA